MSNPVPMFGTQNLSDDDGPVIDSLFIETDSPPNLADAIEPIPVPATVPPVSTTRLFTGELTLAVDWAPVMILPADPKRKGLYLRVYSPTSVATDGIRIADESSKCITSGKVLHGNDAPFTNHTGAVYVLPTGNAAGGAASAPITIEYWSTTE